MQPTNNRSSSVRPRASHAPPPRLLSALFTAIGPFRILVLSCRNSFYRLENACRVPTNSRVLFVLGVLSHVLDMCRIVFARFSQVIPPTGTVPHEGGMLSSTGTVPHEEGVQSNAGMKPTANAWATSATRTTLGRMYPCGNETHCEHLGYKRNAYYPWTNVPLRE